MARIILSELVNDIRNSVSAHTYAIWRGVHYIRNKAATVGNPRSVSQGNARQQVEKNSRVWFAELSTDQRAKWNAFGAEQGSGSISEATQGQKQIIPFNRNRMSGFNAFIMVNGLLQTTTGVHVKDCPLGADAPPQPFGLAVAYVAGPPAKFTLTWNEPTNMPVDANVRIWGMSRKYAHKQLIAIVAAGVKTYDVTRLKGVGGNYIGIPLDYYSFQIDAVSVEGLKCAGSNIADANVV